MKEVLLRGDLPLETDSFIACVATVLELPADRVPPPRAGEDAATGWTISRWLGGLGLGLVRVADVQTFTWAGPWLGRVESSAPGGRRWVVMYGVPSGVVWDPARSSSVEREQIEDGFLLAASDIALAMPPRPVAPTAMGRLETIAVAAAAGESTRLVERARAIAGLGLEGDRYAARAGTFPSDVPGSALTMIEAEVCESFAPPLEPGEHRRNLVTRGIDLNALVGHEFRIGEVPCRGMRLCEPCTVAQRYASRQILRELVHRGGLRADVLADGEIKVGDRIDAAGS